MKCIFFLCFAIFSSRSSAIVGKDLNLKLDPVCKVSIYSKANREFKASCTGTLIDQQTVQTAAHCILDDTFLEVECGQISFDKENATTKELKPGKVYYTTGLTFKEKHKVISIKKEFNYLDKAILKIDKESKLKPAKLVSVSSLEQLLMKNSCYFSGYGRKNGRIGKLHSVKIQTNQFSIDKRNGFFQFTIPKTAVDNDVYLTSLQPNFKTAGSPTPGDSGSSVICKDKNQLLSFGVLNTVGNYKNSPYAMSIEATFSFNLREDLEL